MNKNKVLKGGILMNKVKLFIWSIFALTLLSGCDTMNLGGDNPEGVIKDKESMEIDDNRESLYSNIEISSYLPRIFEQGLSAEDWTTYFTITDEDDGEALVTEDMLSWDPIYDYNEPGIYVLTCTHTNSLGYSNSESLQIEVIDGEEHQEGTVGVEIIDNKLISHFVIDSPEPIWVQYFTIYNEVTQVETTTDMISFSPALDMSVEGEYILTVDYIDEFGEHHTLETTITISEESQYDDIKAMTIYEILYQTNAFDTVRVDGLEVIGVYDQKFLGKFNEEYILISNYGSQDSSVIESLKLGDIVNVVGSIHMSNGYSLNIEILIEQIQVVSRNNDPTTRTAIFIQLNDIFDITNLEFLTYLRETVASYDSYSNQLGGMDVMNDVVFIEDTEYLVEFVMVNHYEGDNPEIYVLSYESYEEEQIPTTIQDYSPGWNYENGEIVSITVDVVSSNGFDIVIGYIDDYSSFDANVVIIDTYETIFDWLVPSLVEGGRISMNAEVVRTDNSNEGYGFVLKPVSEVYVNAADPVYFGKSYGVGNVRVTTALDYETNLQYYIDSLGIIPISEQGYVYEMTATYDSNTNTIGGLSISTLGVQLNSDGEYFIQFVVSRYFEEAPYAEIVILSPYYDTPIYYTMINEIGSLRNLIVSTNNGVDLITATDFDGDTIFSIHIPETISFALSDIVEGDVIHVVGQINSEGYTDTSIEIVAIHIEKE